MDILSCNWDSAKFLLFSDNVFDPLIYYSHLGPTLLSIALLALVFFNNRKNLINKILIFLIISFCLWSLFDLILWATEKIEYIMFFWSIMIFLDLLIYIASFYFVYVFVYRKDLPFWGKTLVGLLFLPLLLFVSTEYNLVFFDFTNCEREAREGILWDYTYIVEIFLIILIFISVLVGFLKSKERQFKKEIILIASGIILFLIAFSWGNIAGSITEDWSIGQYGLFGIPIFIGFLSYSIVKYRTLNIRVLAVQILISAIAILMSAQFFFIRTNLNRVLTAITLFIIFIFGSALIRSVKKEVQQREELENANAEIEKRNEAILERNDKLKAANKEITKRKNQLQRISDSLAIANDKLKILDTAKTDFISMASHQLRTPPTPIKGYSSMLLEGSYGALNEEQKKAIENISAANNQQITFVEDLLAVSRIESGSMKFVFEKCQIGDLCQDVINNLILKARDKNLYLDYNAPATPLPELTIDGNKIREVISNLVDNAIKYTLRGGVTLLAELCEKKATDCLEKRHLRLTISDTGIGVPAEEMPYLFQKFSRGKDITRLNTGGTGLGLYVVKMITKANGGKVWIESPGAGRGSKFIIELPLEQTQETLERNG